MHQSPFKFPRSLPRAQQTTERPSLAKPPCPFLSHSEGSLAFHRLSRAASALPCNRLACAMEGRYPGDALREPSRCPAVR